MTPGAAGTASYHYRGETVAQDETDETDAAARLAAALATFHGYEPGTDLAGTTWLNQAAALLPVVRVLQAEELEAAAKDFARDDNGSGGKLVALGLTARAAALRGEAGR